MKLNCLFALLICTAAFLASCDRDEIEPEVADLGYAYFPLDSGSKRTYQVRRINYDPTNLDSTILDYQLQERFTDRFIDESGHVAFRVERFRRSDSLVAWKLDSIAIDYRTEARGIRNLTNTPIVKLSFPLKANSKWDGNQLNSLAPEEYSVSSFGRPYQLSNASANLNRTYSETLKVLQAFEVDPIVSNDERFEVYAKDVGLIYREEETFTYWQVYENQNVIGQGLIQSGHKSYQTLIDYSL